MTERLHFHSSLSCIGEGNGNPLQCSCLENPRDGGAWWAAVYGVAQSRTRLKHLSSGSSSLLYGPTLTSMHDCRQSRSFDSPHLCLLSLCYFSSFSLIKFIFPRSPAEVFLGASAWRFPVFSASIALREPSPPTGRICYALRLQQPPLHARPLLLCSSDGSLPGGFKQEVVYKSLFKGS